MKLTRARYRDVKYIVAATSRLVDANFGTESLDNILYYQWVTTARALATTTGTDSAPRY